MEFRELVQDYAYNLLLLNFPIIICQSSNVISIVNGSNPSGEECSIYNTLRSTSEVLRNVLSMHTSSPGGLLALTTDITFEDTQLYAGRLIKLYSKFGSTCTNSRKIPHWNL